LAGLEALRARLVPLAKAFLVALGDLYFATLFLWAGLRIFAWDRWGWVFLLNILSPFLFYPLPVVALIAMFVRRRKTWIATGAAFIVLVVSFGELLLPKIPRHPRSETSLRVMSYNVYGFSPDPDVVVRTVLAAKPDIVAFQELFPAVAEQLHLQLAELYPYQVLDPKADVFGMGIISRDPIAPANEGLPGQWIGTPQVVSLELGQASVTLINFHAYAPNFAGQDFRSRVARLDWSIRQQQRQAEALAEFAAHRPQPLLVLGDLNAADQTRAYSIARRVLGDAWNEVGWGFGPTFSLHDLFGTASPLWAARVDHIFHSSHWRALSAQLGTWDGQSDHRPVIAQLELNGPR